MKTLISFFIFVVIGFQLLAVLDGSAVNWPFISYPMYRAKHVNGDYLDVNTKMIAETESGRELTLSADDFPTLKFWHYQIGIINPLKRIEIGRNPSPLQKKMLDLTLDTARNKADEDVVALRFEFDPPMRITRNGAVSVDKPYVAKRLTVKLLEN